MSVSTTFKYNNASSLFANGALDWATLGSAAHCVLLSAAYTPSPTDQYLSAIPAGAIIADQAFTSTAANTAGVCYGVIPQFLALISAQPVVAMLIYHNTGNPNTSPLIYYSSQGSGFPFTAEGFNYAVGYNALNGGWFQA